MALYHLSCKVLSKNKGHNMSAKYSYITRQNSYKQDDIAYYKSGNMPQFGISKPEKFWEAADLYERKNGTLARQLILALPVEFNLEQQKNTMESFIQNSIAGEVPYSFAIHHDKKGENPHAHLIFSERVNLDDVDFYKSPTIFFKQYSKRTKDKKKNGVQKLNIGDSKNRKIFLAGIRKTWADVLNEQLEQNGLTERVSHLSYVDQGIDLVPGQHLGYASDKKKKELEKKLKKEAENIARIDEELEKIAENEILEAKIAAKQAMKDENDFNFMMEQIQAAAAEEKEKEKRKPKKSELVSIIEKMAQKIEQEEKEVKKADEEDQTDLDPLEDEDDDLGFRM